MKYMPAPLVSVVIAFLNEEKFLREAVESVLAQDYTNWELLLIDDGSTDKSPGIAKEFAAAYPNKIKYGYHHGHANKGLSASRNTGIRMAQGELIALLDADDVWLPAKLASQVEIFLQYPGLGMAAEASLYWYSWDDPTKPDNTIAVGAPAGILYPPGSLFALLYPLSTGAAPCPSGLMLSKFALEQAGGFEEGFRKELQLYEDQALLHKIYLKEQVYISGECHNKYRQRAGSIVQQVTQNGHYHTVRRYFLEWLERYLRQEQVRDANLARLLAKAQLAYRMPQVYFLTNTLPNAAQKMLNKVKKRLL